MAVGVFAYGQIKGIGQGMRGVGAKDQCGLGRLGRS